MNTSVIKKYLSVIRRACDLIEAELTSDDVKEAFDDLVESAAINKIESKNIETSTYEAPKLPINGRKKYISDLLEIEDWPEAIPNFIALSSNSEKSKIDRANAVLDFNLGNTIEGANFLDFGCGEGWEARQAAKRNAKTVYGYDIERNDCWAQHKDVKFTTNYDDLLDFKERFDVIFLYDVLDHVLDPEALLKQVKKLLAEQGLVYVRCHPWTSKHASHLPKKGLNKAYIHLFLTFEELVEAGYEPMFTRTEKEPFVAYKWWFRIFNIEKERKANFEALPEFFQRSDIREMLIKEQKIDSKKVDGFFNDMQFPWVDYVLSYKK